jgi:two-component system chemotaxis sensor kinase CheA
LPSSVIFNPLERAARDVAKTLGKRVSFDTQGGDVRLDPRVLATIRNALVQIVFNAVAHGIETEAERAAAGKPGEGRISVAVERRQNRIAFVCHDDGRGVDLEAVRRVAQRRGLLPGGSVTLGAAELLQELLKGGISTSGTVTEVSGRGIGLDVVREAASRLGGSVAVRTEKHRGTTIELVVPLSLSGLAALVVEAGGQAVAIPLDAVRGALRVGAGDMARVAEGQAILRDGKLIPFAPLSRALGAAEADRPAWSALLLEAGGAQAAIGVDRLRGVENIVMRPLPALAVADPVVAGASLDAEGNPQIVLDAERLVAAVWRAGGAAADPAVIRPTILVIDDSLTTRMLEESILQSAGYQVEVAASAEEGIEKAGRKRYQLFLVDVEMPGMDGFGFIEHARADPQLRDIPSILVTSRASPADRRRGTEVGARAYIVKSEFDQVELLERIRRLVG